MDEQAFHNILIDPLPETVTVNGRAYPISSDFRTGMLFEMLSADRTLSDETIALQTLELYYPETIPTDLEAAYAAILWFYRCGYEVKPHRENGNGKADDERVFDYDEDAPLIYAAFMSQYGLDLNEAEHLHWWKFNALFRGLRENERICEVMGYRSVNLSEIKDKDMRAHYATMKQKYALPDGRTVEEKIALVGNIFAGGMA